MARILIVSSEPLRRGSPAGTGIRLFELAKVVADGGHEVTLMSPDGAPDGCRGVVTTPEALRDESARHDAAVVQGHVANDLFAHGDSRLPVAVDLYDPFVVEHLYYRSEEIFRHDLDTTRRSLQRGDFFLCASEPQRLFWLGAILATGRPVAQRFAGDPRLEQVVSVVPFGVPEPPDARPKREHQALIFGTIYEWYDPLLAIRAVRKAREILPALTLTFHSHPNEEQTPRDLEREVRRYVELERLGGVVRFEPWHDYAARGAYYGGFSAALAIFRQSVENDVAMRTRLIDFLWGGLPVVTSAGSATEAIITSYGAGYVCPNGAAEIASAIVAIHEETAYARGQKGARTFAATRPWIAMARPLLEFCSRPRRLL